jgi:hypothetical protein
VRYLAAFGRFWWEFVVGDDWVVAVIVVTAIGITAAVAAGGIAAWWVMPVGVAIALAVSLRRAVAR